MLTVDQHHLTHSPVSTWLLAALPCAMWLSRLVELGVVEEVSCFDIISVEQVFCIRWR